MSLRFPNNWKSVQKRKYEKLCYVRAGLTLAAGEKRGCVRAGEPDCIDSKLDDGILSQSLVLDHDHDVQDEAESFTNRPTCPCALFAQC